MEDTIVQLLKHTESKLMATQPSEEWNDQIQQTFKELKWQLLCVMSMTSNVHQMSLNQLIPTNIQDLNESVSI